MCLEVNILFYFKLFQRYIRRSHGHHAREFDQDAAGFAYAYDLAFDSFEGAFLDLDGLAFAELGADLCDVYQVFVHCGGYGYEVLHRLVGDGERTVGGAVPVVCHRGGVAEGADEAVQGGLGPADEAEVADGRDEFAGDPRSGRG